MPQESDGKARLRETFDKILAIYDEIGPVTLNISSGLGEFRGDNAWGIRKWVHTGEMYYTITFTGKSEEQAEKFRELERQGKISWST